MNHKLRTFFTPPLVLLLGFVFLGFAILLGNAVFGQSPAPVALFTSATGTVCGATYDGSTNLATIQCSVGGKQVLPGGIKIDTGLLLGETGGVVIHVNGISMLFKRAASGDPLSYEVYNGSAPPVTGSVN